MYGGFVAATLAAAGRPPGEREGPWYDRHVKVHEYAGMAATAREIRAHGCPVLLSGPFTTQIHEPAAWAAFGAALGGEPVRLVWVRTTPRRCGPAAAARIPPRHRQARGVRRLRRRDADRHASRRPRTSRSTTGGAPPTSTTSCARRSGLRRVRAERAQRPFIRAISDPMRVTMTPDGLRLG